MKLDSTIKELIKKYAALIETNNFNQLYSDIENNYQLSGYIPELTRVLESAKIYPLEYMTYIPAGMYCESEASEIKIPNNIERIHRNAFESAHAETIIMTDNVRYLGNNCFYDCKQLTNIELSNNLEVIPKYCFFSEIIIILSSFLLHEIKPITVKGTIINNNKLHLLTYFII